jgi:hypothetical protein
MYNFQSKIFTFAQHQYKEGSHHGRTTLRNSPMQFVGWEMNLVPSRMPSGSSIEMITNFAVFLWAKIKFTRPEFFAGGHDD